MYCLFTCSPHNMLTQGNKQEKALASFAERFEKGLSQLPWLNVICCLYTCVPSKGVCLSLFLFLFVLN